MHILRTWMSWMMALNWGDLSVQIFSSSMALSKFFTYSAYIFRNGVCFSRMSPIRGCDALAGDTSMWNSHTYVNQHHTANWHIRNPTHSDCCQREKRPGPAISPIGHALLQVWQQELAVEGVDGWDVGEDIHHHIYWVCALLTLICQFSTEHLWQNRVLLQLSGNRCGHLFDTLFCVLFYKTVVLITPQLRFHFILIKRLWI